MALKLGMQAKMYYKAGWGRLAGSVPAPPASGPGVP
jgi:hypothetical protein